MKGVSVFIVIGLIASCWAQFLNNKPFPTYSLENMPDTEFSCRDKILGGYYADVDAMCQMFHICVKVAGVGVQDFRFLCPNGTAFDQDHQICAEWEDVDCDVSTLYYSSDNFDLYRIGSGFESKAVKYGEDEETFALQRAETGDARLNREHQTQRINQQKQEKHFKKSRPLNNNDRDIFKGSSSSNFFNNRNNGKENDEDYDDNVNTNQDNDRFQRKKLVRKQNRGPAQNENNQNNNNQQNRRPVQQQQSNRQQQDNYQQQNRQQQQQNNHQQQLNRQQQQNNQQQQQNNQQQHLNRQRQQNNQQQQQNNHQQQLNRQQQQNNQQQQLNRNNQQQQQNNHQQELNRQQQQNNLQQQQNNHQQQLNRQQQQNNYQQQPNRQQQNDAQTVRPNRPTGFVNNFAGSSYVPTTSKPTTTASSNDQRPLNNNNNNRQYNNAENFRQNLNNSPQPTYTISTPAPFKQTQQYNISPNRPNNQNNYNNGQYRPSTTQIPQKVTENYPANFPKQSNYNKPTENYPSTAQKFTQKTENYPTQAPVTRNNQFTTHYDIPKVKPTEDYPTQSQNKNIQYNNQFNAQKIKPTENYSTQAPKFNSQYNTQYDVPKTKPIKNDNYPSTQFNKKPTTPFKQQQDNNYPTTFAPKFHKSSNPGNSQFNYNYPSTFAPKNNPSYTQISQQTTHYNSQNNNNFNQPSTPRTTPFTQYTPTVPKITSTTPVARSNRFDETQYDDGSYNPNYDRRDDEFLKTAHSQNIASSRNEYAKTTKNSSPSTQKPHYESPRPFSVSPNTPKATDYPKSTPKPEQKSNKKVKDVSYDYAYYDTNVGSEPEYEIETEIKKATVKN